MRSLLLHPFMADVPPVTFTVEAPGKVAASDGCRP